MESQSSAVVTAKAVEDTAINLYTRTYSVTKMQRGVIIKRLKENGYRITKQRILIIDTILENECSCCKEIYYKVSEIDRSIGIATVYRLVNSLEEIGAINRKNMYKVAYFKNSSTENICSVVLDDGTTHNLSAEKWNAVIRAGLSVCGYLKKQNIIAVTIKECEEDAC